VWKVSGTRETKRLFFFRTEEVDTYYLSGVTGAFISLEKDEMMFHRLMKKSPSKLRDFDDDNDIVLIPRLPKEVPRIPTVKIGTKKSNNILRLTFGVKAVFSELVLLPVWTLKVRHKKTKKKRTIYMDAATGRQLAGYFKSHRKAKGKP
ncbi:MAG: hypothetical protein OQK81_00515, partial [Candidatus Bathyarchaeota archaeon]|nr:hypothetical protein [Candidatus Bathyarchaeota archaeon]